MGSSQPELNGLLIQSCHSKCLGVEYLTMPRGIPESATFNHITPSVSLVHPMRQYFSTFSSQLGYLSRFHIIHLAKGLNAATEDDAPVPKAANTKLSMGGDVPSRLKHAAAKFRGENPNGVDGVHT